MEYTKENYRKGLDEIEAEMDARKRKLIREFALGNNPYKKGDIISDNNGSLQIETISISIGWGYDLPCCSYKGIELKKDGTPMKRQSGRSIYQRNIIEDESKLSK